MDQKSDTKQEGLNIFEDIIQDPIDRLSFTDQQLTTFDAASAARSAAAKPEAPAPSRRFGRRADRKKGAFAPLQSASRQTAKPAEEEAKEPVQDKPAREKSSPSKVMAASMVLNASKKHPTKEEPKEEEDLLMVVDEPKKEPEKPEAEIEEEEEEVIDPGSSLVDDYDYDLYEDKKHFLLTDYPRVEEYLSRQSKQGYHYVRNEGKHYYFHHGTPKNYYYQILYFNEEPPQGQWDLWEEKGWHMLHRNPSKKKQEAGWFVMRNEQKPGSFRQEIENEEEKYRFFRSYSNSCRSTMFLLFICMAICLVMGLLQYFFRGQIYGILFALLLFAVALWFFLLYGRMLRKSSKQVRFLKAKIRLANSEHALTDEQLEENDEDLDEDWQKIDADKSDNKD